MDDVAGLTAQERAARVTWLLADGAELNTLDVASLTGLSERGARALMARLSRVLPLACENGVWVAIGKGSSAGCDTMSTGRVDSCQNG